MGGPLKHELFSKVGGGLLREDDRIPEDLISNIVHSVLK